MDKTPRRSGSGLLAEPLLSASSSAETYGEGRDGHAGLFLAFCLFCLFTQYLLVTFLSPFLPAVASKGGLDSTVIGVIMAMDSLATAVFAPIVGFQLERVGVRTMIMTGLALSAIMCCFLGFLPDLCKSATSLAIAFIVVRFIMGIGGSMVETAAYGTMLHAFKEKRGKVMAAGGTQNFADLN